MCFWSDFWNDDKPCLIIERRRIYHDEPKEELKELREENRRLKLIIKKMLEQGITEEKAKKLIDAEHKLLE